MESAFLKSTSRWFLGILKFESHCCKGGGNQRSLRKILCLWHIELLNVELMPGSVVTKGCSRCRSPEVQEGHQKDTASARLTSERKCCKLCAKQFNKHIWVHLRGEGHGCRITGCIGIQNIFAKENAVLTVQHQCCHLYHVHLWKDAASSVASLPFTQGGHWTQCEWIVWFWLYKVKEQNQLPMFSIVYQLCWTV